MNKLLSIFVVICIFITPTYLSASIIENDISKDDYHDLEFYGITTNTLKLFTEPADLLYTYQIDDDEVRTMTYDEEGNYSSSYSFEGDDFLITLNSETDFTITYNGLAITTSQGDYESELEVKSSSISNIQNVLKTVQEPQYTSVTYEDGIYYFDTIVDDFVVSGEINLDANTFSYTSTLPAADPITVVIYL